MDKNTLKLICNTWKPDDIEFLMICASSQIPEELSYNQDVKWMQVVQCAMKPVKKFYKSKSGKMVSKDYNRYIGIRINNTQSNELIEKLQNSPGFIDYITNDISGICVTTWYFMFAEDIGN